MAKKSTTPNKKSKTDNSSRSAAPRKGQKIEVAVAVVLFGFSLYIGLALLSFFYTGQDDFSNVHNGGDVEFANWTGRAGAFLSSFLINHCVGLAAFIVPFVTTIIGLKLLRMKNLAFVKLLMHSLFFLIWTPLMLHTFFASLTDSTWIVVGGNYGRWLSELLKANISIVGTIMVVLLSFVVYAIFAFKSTIPLLKRLFSVKINLKKKRSPQPVAPSAASDADSQPAPEQVEDEQPAKATEIEMPEVSERPEQDGEERPPFVEEENETTKTEPLTVEIIECSPESDPAEDTNTGVVEIVEKSSSDESNVELPPMEDYVPENDLPNFKFPSIELLKEYDQGNISVSREEQSENQKRIITTLKNFGISIKRIFETIGPTITLYEIVPDDGVRINKIKNLAEDIMLALAAQGIRIIAPMPGKGTVGIEVPNKNPKIVSMRGLIQSRAFQESRFDLPIAIGRTITNEIYTFDLAKMPHLLVAGATGQGKSVGLNAIITSLLYKMHPSRLKLVLVDPKKVEFSIYGDLINHYLAAIPESEEPVITDVEKVKNTLNSLCKEMDMRYELLKLAKVRNIKEYNSAFIKRRLLPSKGHKFLPYIVVVIDEFGDLIMTAGKEIELPIARIAQLARAVGIHMILATQRPSVNVITGIIKANFPARIAFRVTSGVDSKTILDASGAQQLVGKGDMLFSKGDVPVRIQCALVETEEVTDIVKSIQDQASYGMVFELPEPDVTQQTEGVDPSVLEKRDSLFEEAARLIVKTQSGSTSNIQRKFEIGFNRAGRIMDQLEAAGVVGPVNGAKPREVLIQTEYDLDQLLNKNL